MIEEWVLDNPDELARADDTEVLLDLASAGATVRTAVRLAGEAGLDRLNPEGRPRAVFVAGHGTAALAGELLAALGNGSCPVTVLRPSTADDPAGSAIAFTSALVWNLPGWAGPSDLLLALSGTGTEPGLVSLLEQGYARGCSNVVVAPADSPLSEAALQTRGLPLPFVPPTGAPGHRTAFREGDLPRELPSSLWGLLAPALALTDLVGVVDAGPGSVQAAADRLDEVAVRCRPGAETYGNPAKTLAVQLDGVLPLLWSDGPCTGAVALRFAAVLADLAGRPAVPATLPEALSTQYGLLAGHLAPDPDEDDFFRDRTEDGAELRLKVLLLHRSPEPEQHPDQYLDPQPDHRSDHRSDPAVDERADQQVDRGPSRPPTSRRILARARRLATDHQIAVGELVSAHSDDLEAIAELVALTDFAAAYLGLASSGAADVAAGAAPADT
ncbi:MULTISPECIES: SIS domain-containing protein [Streptacidiphilus]|uniref:SIS domain-containing protein n=1 Tax=Streptacidiphilus cavernicola TaxID=3342716 RepID=A0ABV6US29_9ACTN|nr:SIS domain-containing protein [Streptacidiphilus jeojiense]